MNNSQLITQKDHAMRTRINLLPIIIGFIVALYGLAWWLISRGTGLRH